MEYYSAIKKNERMPFAATWLQLEMIILSEVSQKELAFLGGWQMQTITFRMDKQQGPNV